MKRWLKRFTPDRAELREHRHLRIFGKLLQDPNLWHLNRRSVSGAFGVGLFVMYLPPLGQMVIAAAGAIALRVNLPISVALVWISNPLTIPPMFYFSYRRGTWILDRDVEVEPFDLNFWLDWHNWLGIIGPLTVGSLICGAVCAAVGYFAVQSIWRWNLVRQIHLRRERLRKSLGPDPHKAVRRGGENRR